MVHGQTARNLRIADGDRKFAETVSFHDRGCIGDDAKKPRLLPAGIFDRHFPDGRRADEFFVGRIRNRVLRRLRELVITLVPPIEGLAVEEELNSISHATTSSSGQCAKASTPSVGI